MIEHAFVFDAVCRRESVEAIVTDDLACSLLEGSLYCIVGYTISQLAWKLEAMNDSGYSETLLLSRTTSGLTRLGRMSPSSSVSMLQDHGEVQKTLCC